MTTRLSLFSFLSGTALVAARTPHQYALHALAIGDWGSTMDKPGSCCNKYRHTQANSPAYFQDLWAQENIAHMLANSAAKDPPRVILGHGDNFYWNGLTPRDVATRFEQTFERVYDQPSLAGIPWVNVMGNHDYGGSMYLCFDAEGNYRPCASIIELLKTLRQKRDWQSQYVSPNGNRWHLHGNYYTHRVTEGNVTLEIFNVDTNYVDAAARQICCQCYGYSRDNPGLAKDVKCANVDRGHALCLGGNVEMFNACKTQLDAWSEEALARAKVDIATSSADWKIINSHYSPHFHMGSTKREDWFDLLRGSNVQVFMNGHSHGENHDMSPTMNTHFFTNGAGGGIQSESIGQPPPDVRHEIQSMWIGHGAPYGFFQLSADKEWLRMRFMTFADDWKYALDKKQVEKGSTKVGYCWLIPRDGSTGKACDLADMQH